MADFEILDDLAGLHEDVDRAVEPLTELHRDRLQCRRGCADCCVDELTVFAVEAERIRRAHAVLLAEGEPAPVGRCAFLDAESACRVYDVRPYVCRTQGLPLRWLDDESACRDLEQELHRLHAMLRCHADQRAARTVLSICARGSDAS